MLKQKQKKRKSVGWVGAKSELSFSWGEKWTPIHPLSIVFRPFPRIRFPKNNSSESTIPEIIFTECTSTRKFFTRITRKFFFLELTNTLKIFSWLHNYYLNFFPWIPLPPRIEKWMWKKRFVSFLIEQRVTQQIWISKSAQTMLQYFHFFFHGNITTVLSGAGS